jgi:hypothetical protein
VRGNPRASRGNGVDGEGEAWHFFQLANPASGGGGGGRGRGGQPLVAGVGAHVVSVDPAAFGCDSIAAFTAAEEFLKSGGGGAGRASSSGGGAGSSSGGGTGAS